uniref:POPLD domain-containing protein n=1 Tax=Macrostomum lignano TaxID=282301 RepID=A0A1I8F6P4_9PLAT
WSARRGPRRRCRRRRRPPLPRSPMTQLIHSFPTQQRPCADSNESGRAWLRDELARANRELEGPATGRTKCCRLRLPLYQMRILPGKEPIGSQLRLACWPNFETSLAKLRPPPPVPLPLPLRQSVRRPRDRRAFMQQRQMQQQQQLLATTVGADNRRNNSNNNDSASAISATAAAGVSQPCQTRSRRRCHRPGWPVEMRGLHPGESGHRASLQRVRQGESRIRLRTPYLL